MLGIIKMHRDEFREDNLGARVYKITFLGIPIFWAKFTTTSSQVVRNLTPITGNNKINITGFNINSDEIKNKS